MTEDELERRDFSAILAEIEKSTPQEDIARGLVASGWEREHAARYVSGVATARALGTLGGQASTGPTLDTPDAGSLAPAYRELAWGAAIFAVAAGVTGWSYLSAHAPDGDGRFYAMPAIAALGLIRMVRGALRLFV